MSKRPNIKYMMDEVEKHGAVFTLTRKGLPVAVVLPHSLWIAMHDNLEKMSDRHDRIERRAQ